jgi:hypothetical protein
MMPSTAEGPQDSDMAPGKYLIHIGLDLLTLIPQKSVLELSVLDAALPQSHPLRLLSSV